MQAPHQQVISHTKIQNKVNSSHFHFLTNGLMSKWIWFFATPKKVQKSLKMPKSQMLGPFPPIENIFFGKKNFSSVSIHQKPLKKHWDIRFWELLQFSTLAAYLEVSCAGASRSQGTNFGTKIFILVVFLALPTETSFTTPHYYPKYEVWALEIFSW